jgi:hypothetical protein
MNHLPNFQQIPHTTIATPSKPEYASWCCIYKTTYPKEDKPDSIGFRKKIIPNSRIEIKPNLTKQRHEPIKLVHHF